MSDQTLQQSFLPISADSHFPIQNLPFGVFKTEERSPRIGVAIGEKILDMQALEQQGLLQVAEIEGHAIFQNTTLNEFMKLGRAIWKKVRARLTELLSIDCPVLQENADLQSQVLVPMDQATMLMPVQIGDYTDFYSSKEHATNVGKLFRDPENALMPNWLHLPVGYHGRASSVVISGTNLHRPTGQTIPKADEPPVFGPSRLVDYELEMGTLIGPGNELGTPIPVKEAWQHCFGFVLVNDWSARDIQKWEYVPLGPFLAKSFGTSISPWIVTLEALEPFRCDRPEQDPTPLPYLQSPINSTFDIQLEVTLKTESLAAPFRLTTSNFKYLYWDVSQQIAHHTVNGCNLQSGDLLASGTISGPTEESAGCLLERTKGGKQEIELPDGEPRKFLQDNDEIIMTGYCQGDGYRIGFGEVKGTILPAKKL